MDWPSSLLLISLVAFLASVVGAMLLQFSKGPPRATAAATLGGALVGIAFASIYAVQSPVAEERNEGPTLLSILLP